MSKVHIFELLTMLSNLPYAAGSAEGPAARTAESPTTVEEKTEQSEDKDDIWKKLKDFAG